MRRQRSIYFGRMGGRANGPRRCRLPKEQSLQGKPDKLLPFKPYQKERGLKPPLKRKEGLTTPPQKGKGA